MMASLSEGPRIDRMVGLCKVWGAIKYFHPYLAYRHDIDWDAALIGAIPEVEAADDADDYTKAIQGMLMALGDPATRVLPREPEGAVPDAHERHPVYGFYPGDILVVSIKHYDDLADFFGTAKKMDDIKRMLPKARGVLFDLRPSATPTERGRVRTAFLESEVLSFLASTPLVTPGQRTRMHRGFVPPKGFNSGEYESAFKVTDGRWIPPAAEAKDIPTVFLIDSKSELPPEALALQATGKAAIVTDGDTSDASLVATHRIPLSEGVIVEMRLGELVAEDGSGGFGPDLVVEPSLSSRNEDHAFIAALGYFDDFKPGTRKRLALPACAVPVPEKAYTEMAFPPTEYRLLAAFRIWAVINYFFPYKDLMEEDWDAVLREYIPVLEGVQSALDYHLAIARMITHIHDSHGFVNSPIIKNHFGKAWPPIRLQIIEGCPVVTSIIADSTAEAAGICVGDVVVAIDGQDFGERIAYFAKYRSASTRQRLLYRAAFSSLSGSEGSEAILTIRDRCGVVKEIRLVRKLEYGSLEFSERGGHIAKLVAQDIGYADLDRLEVSEVDGMFEQFKDTKAIIFDMRGYPKGTAWAIAPRLCGSNGIPAAVFQRPMILAPEGPDGEIASQTSYDNFVQAILPIGKRRYEGITVMLMDERTQSQAEHTGLFFEAANGTKFIGSPTAGANGDVTNFNVPGGICIWFTGQSVRHADGRQLQRIGLVPDIEVQPSIKGIQDGRDEVLEKAIEYIRGQLDGCTK